jgi:hypothetical protein
MLTDRIASGKIAAVTSNGAFLVALADGRWGIADRFDVAASRTPATLRVGDSVQAEIQAPKSNDASLLRLHKLGALPMPEVVTTPA